MFTVDEEIKEGESGEKESRDLLKEIEVMYLASRVTVKDARPVIAELKSKEIELFFPTILEKIQNIITDIGIEGFLQKYVTKKGEILIEEETHTLISSPELYSQVLTGFKEAEDPDSETGQVLKTLYFIKLSTILEKVNGKFNMSREHGRYLEVKRSVHTGYATIIKQMH